MSGDDLLLGLDYGSGGIRAVIITARGEPAGEAGATVPGGNRHGEVAVDDVVGTAIAVMAAVLGEVDANRVAAIGVASVGEAGTLVDRDGTPLGPVIAWNDERPVRVAGDWLSRIGREEIQAETGQVPDTHHVACKLLWLAGGGTAADGATWMPVSGLVTRALCGEVAVDPGLAAKTLLFNPRSCDWSDRMLDTTGIHIRQLPEVRPTGSRLGGLIPAVARQLGLPTGIPVGVPGHDHLLGSALLARSGPSVVDSTGNAEAVICRVDGPWISCPAGGSGFSVSPDVTPHRHCLVAPAGYGGALVDWWGRLAWGDSVTYSTLFEAIREPSGPTGLLVLPGMGRRLGFQSGPARPGEIRGLVPGLSRESMLVGLLEGNAYTLRRLLELVDSPGRLLVEGGAAKASPWLQIKADVLGIPVEAPAIPNSAATAAALMAGIGNGRLASLADASWLDQGVSTATYQPDPVRASAYNRTYREFLRSYDATGSG